MKVLIGAPVCPGKEYSINEWASWIANQEHDAVGVCLCVNGDDEEECASFAAKLRDLVIERHGRRVPLLVLESSHFGGTVFQKLHPARELIRKAALAADYDALLWLDTDTVPLFNNAITRLLAWKEPVVSGLYFYKKSRVPLALNPKSGRNFTIDELSQASEQKKLLVAHSVGLGCLLMYRSVLEKVAFDYSKHGERVGEDFMLCEEITEAYHAIYLDPWVTCRHYSSDEFKIE